MNTIFATEIIDVDGVLQGPFRQPRQMLQEQTYDGHMSLHDDSQAQELGFSGAPIEGPTHFSQFDPLLFQIWGNKWFERGCISSHFKTVVTEGEELRAFVAIPEPDSTITRIWATKSTGEPVLEGTASVGPNHPETELERLLASRPTPENLVILEEAIIGEEAENPTTVQMKFDQHLGDAYPFTLSQKLEAITENCPWYSDSGAADSPWGKAIIPVEMISPLAQFAFNAIGSIAKRPVIGLFADLEIKLINGPLFVGHSYRLEKKIVGLGESRRTESLWTRTSIIDAESDELVATTLLNCAYLKNSYPAYDKEAVTPGKSN